jgi:prevent-host-death family protein
MGTTVNIHEAKTHLSKLIERVTNGEDVVIAKAGKPVVRLVAVTPGSQRRRLGFMNGLGLTVPQDIKSPFKEEIEEMFYGNPDKFKDL